MVQFEWDEQKNKANRKKHGIWFEEATPVFIDPGNRFFRDRDHSGSEDRFVVVGYNTNSSLLVVVYWYRNQDEVIRIISARKATKKERRFYEEGI